MDELRIENVEVRKEQFLFPEASLTTFSGIQAVDRVRYNERMKPLGVNP